jgi:hypothetical protein
MVVSESVNALIFLAGGIFAYWAPLHSGFKVSAGAKNSCSFHGRDFLFFLGEESPLYEDCSLDRGEPSWLLLGVFLLISTWNLGRVLI